MKAYWFTIAAGPVYAAHAERLRRSLERHDISLAVLTSDILGSMQAKWCKIRGILEAPRGYDRIVYLDADTLVLDPRGMDQLNGAWRVPWRIPDTECLPKTLDAPDLVERLHAFYRHHELAAFEPGGSLEGVEWNSGVIAGDRATMTALAKEWAVWWKRILDLFGGHFRRDQLSFRIAYHNVCLVRGIRDLPAAYNWIVSYFGVNPNASILHRTMVRNVPWLNAGWRRIVQRHLAGENVGTVNRCFDLSWATVGRPSLKRRIDLDRAATAALLRQTLAWSRPEQVLLCCAEEDDSRCLSLIREATHCVLRVDSLDSMTAKVPLAEFDLVVFCGMGYRIPTARRSQIGPDMVFCFAGIHDLSLYQFLHEFAYVRLLGEGFGIFSQSSRICSWEFRPHVQQPDSIQAK